LTATDYSKIIRSIPKYLTGVVSLRESLNRLLVF
jgi:hypothetical protein